MSFETCISFLFLKTIKVSGVQCYHVLNSKSFIVLYLKKIHTGLERHVNDDRIKMFGVEMTFNNKLLSIAITFIV